MSGAERLGAAHGRVRIGDIGPDAGQLFDEGAGCLHYCAPTHGGWGVLRTALLVPELYVLFVCPAACGRHGAIAAFEQGLKHRVGYLCIEDEEIVLGSYEDEIRRTVPLLMERLAPRPKAVMIVVSCIDDLLGTDYAPMVADFEAEHGIPFRIGRMNPITMGSGLPPQRRVQRDMYDLLAPAPARDGSIGLIGPFRPLAPESELHGMLARAGLGPIRHVADCATFADFQAMAAARLNLVTRPEGLAAAEHLEKTLGTPFVVAPV
ncbi:nitrogenase component 1, partial [Rhodoplanes sp. TEM]